MLQRQSTVFIASQFSSIPVRNAPKFELFPNPTANAIYVKGENLMHVEVIDQQGRIVHIQNLQGRNVETLFLGSLPAGNYIVRIKDKSKKTAAKPLQIRR